MAERFVLKGEVFLETEQILIAARIAEGDVQRFDHVLHHSDVLGGEIDRWADGYEQRAKMKRFQMKIDDQDIVIFKAKTFETFVKSRVWRPMVSVMFAYAHMCDPRPPHPCWRTFANGLHGFFREKEKRMPRV